MLAAHFPPDWRASGCHHRTQTDSLRRIRAQALAPASSRRQPLHDASLFTTPASSRRHPHLRQDPLRVHLRPRAASQPAHVPQDARRPSPRCGRADRRGAAGGRCTAPTASRLAWRGAGTPRAHSRPASLLQDRQGSWPRLPGSTSAGGAPGLCAPHSPRSTSGPPGG
jgi:hypothetical protein